MNARAVQCVSLEEQGAMNMADEPVRAVEFDPEEHIRANPLLRFSIYTDSQSKIVLRLGHDVLAHLAEFEDSSAGKNVMDAYNAFWLWVIAAYEVVRTMSQARICFSLPAAARILELKRRLAVIRVPFAKQEMPGRAVPTFAELSMIGIHRTPPDIKFRVDDQIVSASELVKCFAEVILSIGPDDVLADHRTTYKQAKVEAEPL